MPLGITEFIFYIFIFQLWSSSLKSCNVQVFIRGCNFIWVYDYSFFLLYLVAVLGTNWTWSLRVAEKDRALILTDLSLFSWQRDETTRVTTRECCRKILSAVCWKMGPFYPFGFFVVVKAGASRPLCLLKRRISAMLPNVSCHFKSTDEQRNGKTKRWVKLQIVARLHSQTLSRISIYLKSFFPATWQMKVQYSLSFLPSFWSAEDPEGNNVADESHTVFCR